MSSFLSGITGGLGLVSNNTYDPFSHIYNPNAGGMDSVQKLLQARAMGQGGPSAADISLQQGIDQAKAAAMGAAGGANNPAQARRLAINQTGQLAQQGAVSGAQQKMQEETGAQTGYLNMLQAQQQMQAAQNQAANSAAGNIAQANANSQAQANQQLLGGITSGVGSLAAMFSDERLKHNIDENAGSTAISNMLRSMKPAQYEYNDPRDGYGPQVGVMAQDVARSRAGRSFVKDTPHGLALDGTRAIGPILAALAHLNKKIDAKAYAHG